MKQGIKNEGGRKAKLCKILKFMTDRKVGKERKE